MAENYSFFNSKDHDRVYNARHWADYFFPLFKSGVFNGDLQVVANGGMTVKIKSGYAWIDGYGYHLTDGLVVDLETASGNMNRADSIVIRLDLTNRWIKAFCKTGSYYAGAGVPPAPEITATIHEIVISHISIAAGVTEITQDMITDTRMDGDICGWVCGAVDQIDFSQIKTQFDTFFANYEEEIRTQYGLYMQDIDRLETQGQDRYDSMDREFTNYENQQKENITKWQQDEKEYLDAWISAVQTEYFAWLDRIKDILDENAAGHLQNEVDNLTVDAFNRYYGLQAQETLFLDDGSIKTTNEEAEIITEFGFDESGNETAVTTVKPITGMYDYVKTTIFFAEKVVSSTEKKERV